MKESSSFFGCNPSHNSCTNHSSLRCTLYFVLPVKRSDYSFLCMAWPYVCLCDVIPDIIMCFFDVRSSAVRLKQERLMSERHDGLH
jgi:hypothetical protein